MWAQLVAAGCPNLQHLSLKSCKNVTDGGLGAVASGCPNLQHLDLYGCTDVTDAVLKALSPNAAAMR